MMLSLNTEFLYLLNPPRSPGEWLKRVRPELGLVQALSSVHGRKRDRPPGNHTIGHSDI